MVFAFICHSLSSIPPRLLYSAVYGDDITLIANQGVPSDAYREVRKEKLLQIACRIQSEYSYRIETRDVGPRALIRDESSTDSHLYEKGWFRLSANDPYPSPMNVHWLAYDSCAFVLVCEHDENKLQAENIMKLIVQYVKDHVMSMEQKIAEIILKGEWMSAILHVYLPNGQLVFMNHKVIKQSEKDLDTIIK